MSTLRIAGLSIAIAAALLGARAAHAAMTTESCLATKRQAQGKFQQCRATEEAKALEGKPADLAKCSTKFQDKIASLSEKASKAGITCRYLDNGDGTVTDYDTGLQWEKKVSPGFGATDPHDVDNTYDWSTSGTAADGPAFGDFLSRLNTCSFGGLLNFTGFAFHCDWRLPTIEELQTILLEPFPCGTNPCIDPIFGPTASTYLSSTTSTRNSVLVWRVVFIDGSLSDVQSKAFSGPVRAVRGGL